MTLGVSETTMTCVMHSMSQTIPITSMFGHLWTTKVVTTIEMLSLSTIYPPIAIGLIKISILLRLYRKLEIESNKVKMLYIFSSVEKLNYLEKACGDRYPVTAEFSTNRMFPTTEKSLEMHMLPVYLSTIITSSYKWSEMSISIMTMKEPAT